MAERSRCNFDTEECYELFYDEQNRKVKERAVKDIVENPEIMVTPHKLYEWSPEEIQLHWMKKLNFIYFNLDKDFYFK